MVNLGNKFDEMKKKAQDKEEAKKQLERLRHKDDKSNPTNS